MRNWHFQLENHSLHPSMSDALVSVPADPIGFERGFTIEHVMLSVTVVSKEGSAGQFDDSIAHLVRKHLPEYFGVVDVLPEVLYKHTKIEQHRKGCECGYCNPIAGFMPQNP